MNRFYSMEALIRTAYEAGDFDTATRLAKEYLDLAGIYRCDWNYGNATHDANSFLGLMSLKNRDVEAAAAYLVAAGKSSGSPQLNSFGPDMELANALLKEGRVEPVKEYLRGIKLFWSSENGRVDEWLASLDKGERPELNRFPMLPRILEMLVMGIVLAWPAMLVAGFLYFLRRRISRKWLFGAIGLVAGYAAMMVAGWGTSAFVFPWIIDAMDTANVWLVMIAVGLTSAAGLLFPPLAIFGVSRIFVARREPG